MTSSPRARLGVSALALAALAALGASFAAGVAVGGREPDDRIPVAGPEKLLPAAGALVRATSCDQLRDWYVDNTLDRVTPWGWTGNVIAYAEDSGVLDGALDLPDRAPATSSATSSDTGTNVQEAGVDEADVVKTDGTILVRIDGDDLTTYDVTGDSVRRLSRIDLPGSDEQGAELLLVGGQAIVVAHRQDYGAWPADGRTHRGWSTPGTTVHRVDLADPAEPELVSSTEYGARLVSARQYGETVRLVLGTGLPQLDFVEPGDGRSEREALAENRRIVRASTAADWLPTVADGDAEPEQAVGCDAMSIPEDFSGGGSVVVVGFEAGDPTDRTTAGVATSSDLVYSSTDRLYLATGTAWSTCCVILEDWGGRMAPDVAHDGTTTLHAFALTGTSAEYVASGEVDGSIRDRWSMDEADGVLRVAVGPSSETGNHNAVVTFREQDGVLEELGRVDRLGVDEEIKSVRWFDDLAVVVTFRQTDPLYAVDLSRPAKPVALGELKIPGFSSYLHPIGDDRMIGIGTNATLDGMTRGGQAALFDLGDLRNPRRLDKVDYGQRRETLAGTDPRQFTWLADRRTALTVVAEWGKAGGQSAWVSVLEVGAEGTLTNRLLRGADGTDDVAGLRTVPLPDGRVVLSAGDEARFLDW